jgi:hypothetical protein
VTYRAVILCAPGLASRAALCIAKEGGGSERLDSDAYISDIGLELTQRIRAFFITDPEDIALADGVPSYEHEWREGDVVTEPVARQRRPRA